MLKDLWNILSCCHASYLDNSFPEGTATEELLFFLMALPRELEVATALLLVVVVAEGRRKPFKKLNLC